MWRDNFSIRTWLCFGAAAQSIAFLLLGHYALVPVVVYLLFRAADTYAKTTGLKSNPRMENIIGEKFSAQFPDSSGHYGSKASSSDVCVMLLSSRTNHPLGAFAPGFAQVGAYMQQMTKELAANSQELGLLGMGGFLGTSRTTSNEVLLKAYFRSAKHVHDYAQGPLHRKAWDWWNKTVKQHPHLTIQHELYHVPAGQWESIYVNAEPNGVAATQHLVTKEDGEVVWMSPVVDARKGILKSSAGRMGRDV